MTRTSKALFSLAFVATIVSVSPAQAQHEPLKGAAVGAGLGAIFGGGSGAAIGAVSGAIVGGIVKHDRKQRSDNKNKYQKN